jgi:hypothetical protein
VTTLNTLAQFLGYADWRAYAAAYQPVPEPVNEPVAHDLPQPDPVSPIAALQQPKQNRRALVYMASGMVVLIVLVSLFTFSGRKRKPDPPKFSFSLNKVLSEGVPNSVVFTYDATAAQTDSVYIVQTWDLRRKTLVPRDKHSHSAIYYYPGYFKTRLLVDGEEMKSQDLQITSNGWLGLVENEPIPLYFKRPEFIKSDRVEVDTNTLRTYNLSLHPKAPRVRLFNQLDLDDLADDNFIFETKLKNEFNTGSGACQRVEVLIQCKDDIMIIPLTAKPCIGDLMLAVAGYYVNSKNADLSGFGCDLTQWTTLRLETVNRQMRILVNGKEVYNLTIPNEPKGIVGLQYRFYGVGAVKDTWFRSRGKVYDFGPDSVRVYRDSL